MLNIANTAAIRCVMSSERHGCLFRRRRHEKQCEQQKHGRTVIPPAHTHKHAGVCVWEVLCCALTPRVY